MSQQELAERISAEQKQVSNWESSKGNPTSETLINLAQVLECSVDWLLGLSDRADQEKEDQALSTLDDWEREVLLLLRAKPAERRHDILEILRRL